MTKTTYLPTGKLETGMIVHDHGSRFKLLGRVEDHRNATTETTGFKAFYTEYLGAATDWNGEPAYEAIPAHWHTKDHPWIIQANNLVSWPVEA